MDESERKRQRIAEWRRQQEEKQSDSYSISLASLAPVQVHVAVTNTNGSMRTMNSRSVFDEVSTVDEPKNKVIPNENPQDVDPLDAFMMNVNKQVEQQQIQDYQKQRQFKTKSTNVAAAEPATLTEESSSDEDRQIETLDTFDIRKTADLIALANKRGLSKKKELIDVDHSKIDYPPFRKDFYVFPTEMQKLSSEAIDALRASLDNITIRGKNCPLPVIKWTLCGMHAAIFEQIKRAGFLQPTPIQAQAIPAITSGRDVIGVARTGSGKTLAFVLPMIRHVMDRAPLKSGQGPKALILTPTRELATQTVAECRRFMSPFGLRAVCAYGGSAISEQIADLKRGADVVVCTPGRLIDLLCASGGRVTNLRNVTFVVLDEADRLFDLGFEPQVLKILNNIRPDRQTVMFSATFPRQMDALARRILKRPLEIIVGAKSVVASDITQIVKVVTEETRFVELLSVLGQWFESRARRILIFVDRQEAADNLLRDLMRKGYPCASIHGGKEQGDRDTTIEDFKNGVHAMLIATSVAARGLDVKQLDLVVNYDCPNHYEDYVHRVGRTGRAGQKGTSVTFVLPHQERMANEIVNALRASHVPIPADLDVLAKNYTAKVASGEITFQGSIGFGGKGLERLDKDRKLMKMAEKKAYGGDDISDEEDQENETLFDEDGEPIWRELKVVKTATSNDAPVPVAASSSVMPLSVLERLKDVAERVDSRIGTSSTTTQLAAATATTASSANGTALTLSAEGAARGIVLDLSVTPPVFRMEIEINDFPQRARYRVTSKETCQQIRESTRANITVRGRFYAPGKQPVEGERKLYLIVEGDSEWCIDRACAELKRHLTEALLEERAVMPDVRQLQMGRYSVL